MAKQPDLELARETTVAEVVRYFKRNQKKLKVHVHDGPIKSVRTEKHRGREVKITAIYDIRIDGRRLGGHLEVGSDGHVHYHGLPNYSWGSMVDMCKQIIDSFPEHFPSAGKPPLRAVSPRNSKAKKRSTPARKKSSGRAKGKRG